MKLIAQVKLLTIPESQTALLKTLEAANAGCNAVSAYAWQQHKFGKYAIQKDRYYRLKEQFGLTAQLVIRVIAKVGDAYKLDKRTKRTFKPHGSIAYDARILRWNLRGSTVSIWTIDGRLTIPFATGARQRELLQSHHGESDLVYHNGSFDLLATCEIPEPEPVVVEGVLGVDMGIATIATDSDGTSYSGTHLKSVRHRHNRLRRKLQKNGTLAAKRRLKKLSGQEKRFAQNTNHAISKQIVEKAQGTKRAISIENLGGIRSRTTVRKSQRVYLQSWSFYQLRTFPEYKAQRVGVPVHVVDPRNTSRTCPRCGTVDKRNRPNQKTFKCVSCGYAAHADHIAAVIIGSRGAVNHPHVSDAAWSGGHAVVPETSWRL